MDRFKSNQALEYLYFFSSYRFSTIKWLPQKILSWNLTCYLFWPVIDIQIKKTQWNDNIYGVNFRILLLMFNLVNAYFRRRAECSAEISTWHQLVFWNEIPPNTAFNFSMAWYVVQHCFWRQKQHCNVIFIIFIFSILSV